MITLGLLFGCAGPHKFGPYKGKVVDADTGEPIEGAVVFMRFSTEGGQFIGLGGGNTAYADAIEYLTDTKGEFNIPVHWVFVFRFLHLWEDNGQVIIFKPSYGAFPKHPKASIGNIRGGPIPENEYAIIKLPKLNTVEERNRNLGYATFSDELPLGKWEKLFELRNIESIAIGRKPWPKPSM